MGRLLILNLGSTSTKVAVYQGNKEIWTEKINHDRTDLENSSNQMEFRFSSIANLLTKKNEKIEEFDAYVSRGGTIQPVGNGSWVVTERMIEDATSKLFGEHPCNLGLQIVYKLASLYSKPALTVDPPASNELCTEATYTGIPSIRRQARFHALNHRATGRKYAEDAGKDYYSLNLIVAHMGGGITVAAHRHGKIVDVNNGLEGEGPFALERAGTVPSGDLIDLCFEGTYDRTDMRQLVNGKGGVSAYLNTTNALEIHGMISNGNTLAKEVIDAMSYQVSKEITSLSVLFSGKVDAILLTGGLAHWEYFTDKIIRRVSHIGPVHIYPGENEMQSLAAGADRVLEGIEDAHNYDLIYPKLGVNYV